MFKIQVIEGDDWREKAKELTMAYKNIEAVRGNIFAEDGALLATSLPIYEIRMDLVTDPITDKVFNENVDSLALCLSNLFQDKSKQQYKAELKKGRQKKSRYHFIQRNVRYNELKELKTFPIFRLGKYKGGLIYIQKNKRELPFRNLAARTLGYDRESAKPVGIEGAYNSYLKGVSGKRLMQKIAGNVWMPVNDENEVEPDDGADVFTTIDVNIQDVAHTALLRQLQLHSADHGCVAVMEVATGEVKAIVNLSRVDSLNYIEKYNYVIGESTEPGSTFKLASLMAAMEDGYADLGDMVDTEDGTTKFYDYTMRDSHEGGFGRITLQESFEKSSNVAVSKIIQKHYQKNPQRFIDKLTQFGLATPLNLEIAGEGVPKIKNRKDKDWSGVTLPVMSIGYETRSTPMQMLTFYNTVANNGVMVKPMFVKELREKGKVVKSFSPTIVRQKICSQQTIDKAKKMLEGVVERGTATNLKNPNFKIAGKTGTAQIANGKYGYKYQQKVSYQASFCGYFPADNPKYTCIVVVNAPSNKVYYGNLVAGPIFKEIADKIYSSSLDIHKDLLAEKEEGQVFSPYCKSGKKSDFEIITQQLNLKNSGAKNEDIDWVSASTKENEIVFSNRKISENQVPNVAGMGIRDAVFLLENNGLVVKTNGRGIVSKQSIPAGTKIKKGTIILLELA
ncbi:MAG: penicillin-binding protein [Bacteroidota bacterium]